MLEDVSFHKIPFSEVPLAHSIELQCFPPEEAESLSAFQLVQTSSIRSPPTTTHSTYPNLILESDTMNLPHSSMELTIHPLRPPKS